MQQVNKNLVFGQFVIFVMIDVDYVYFVMFVVGRYVYKVIIMVGGEVWLIKEIVVVFFGYVVDVICFGLFRKGSVEGVRVLFGVVFDCVGCIDSGWFLLDYVVVLCLCQFFFEWQFKLSGVQIFNYSVNCCQGCVIFGCGLCIKE